MGQAIGGLPPVPVVAGGSVPNQGLGQRGGAPESRAHGYRAVGLTK